MRYFFSLFLKMLPEMILLISDGILFQIPIDSNIIDCWNLLVWQYGKLMLSCTTKRVWCPWWGLNSSMKDFILRIVAEKSRPVRKTEAVLCNSSSKIDYWDREKDSINLFGVANGITIMFCKHDLKY